MSKTRLTAAFSAAVLCSLVLASGAVPPGYGATAQATKLKPKYRLAVTIAGVPSKITLNTPYTYTVKVKNTGRLAFKKGVRMTYRDANFVTGSSPMYSKKYPTLASDDVSIVGWTNIGSIKPGAARIIKVYSTYDDATRVQPQNGEIIEVTVDGIGTSVHKDLRTGAYY